MKKLNFYAVTTIITAVLALIIVLAGLNMRQERQKKTYPEFEAVAARVVDGDTLVTDTGIKVRLLGVDTPELHHPDYPVQRFAKEAAEFLSEKVSGKKCRFKYNIARPYDKYKRMLAFIYLPGEEMSVNAQLVKRGYAYASVSDIDPETQEYLALEKIARGFRKGIWQAAPVTGVR